MLRPLPRLVAPFRDETITSYLHRLAGGNRIDPAGLRYLLARQRPQGRAGAARPARRHHRACPARRWPAPCRRSAPRPSCPACTCASRPRARDGWSFARLPGLRGRPAGHPVGAARRRRLRPAPPLDQQIPRAARPHRPAGDPARTPPAPAADPPPRPGPGHARVPRRAAHLHRLAPGRAARPRLRPPHGDLPRPRLGRPRRMDAPRPPTPPPTRSPSRWPGCSPARTGANASSAKTGPGTTNSPPNYAAPSPPATPGTTRPPAGAATETTRCSNGDCTPATSQFEPLPPGHRPEPARNHPAGSTRGDPDHENHRDPAVASQIQ